MSNHGTKKRRSLSISWDHRDRGGIQLSVERNRAQRPREPQEVWHWPDYQRTADVPSPHVEPGQALSKPLYHPTVLGNSDPPIAVGYRKTLPAIESPWTDAAWRDVPLWTLRRNEAPARLPRYSTEVKLVQNGHTLAVIARCVEPGETVAHAKDRDTDVDHDDSLQVYLATWGRDMCFMPSTVWALSWMPSAMQEAFA
jgi:hypothetical protein